MIYNKKMIVILFVLFLFFLNSCTNEDLEEWGIFPQDAVRISAIEPSYSEIVDTIPGTENFSRVRVEFFVKEGELQHQYVLNLYKYEIIYFYENGDTVYFKGKTNPNAQIYKLSFSINYDVEANSYIDLYEVPYYPNYLKGYRPDRDQDSTKLNRFNLKGKIIFYGRERLSDRYLKGEGVFTVILYSK